MRIIWLLLLSVISAINIDTSYLTPTANLQSKVQKTKWGKIALLMADIAKDANGPVKQLQEAVSSFQDSISKSMDIVDKEYKKKTDHFNRDINKIEINLNQGKEDIGQLLATIEDYLNPREAQIKEVLQQVEQNLQLNEKSINEETLRRQNELEQHFSRMNENQGALEKIDECLSLIEGMLNTGVFLQIDRLKRAVQFISPFEKRNGKFWPLVKAIMQMTQQPNFKDQQQMKNIKDLFNELRVMVVNEMNSDQAQEFEHQEYFTQRMQNLNTEKANFQKQINEQTYNLVTIQTKIEEYKGRLEHRKQDVQVFQEQYDEYQKAYATETGVYQQLRQNYLKDQEAAEDANKLLNSSEFLNGLKNLGNDIKYGF